MHVRKASVPHFYAGDCARATEQFLNRFSVPAEPAYPVAGIVPHAGCQYSGAVAAKVFQTIRQKRDVSTFVIFGAVHRWAGINGIYPRGAWATPLGDMEIDESLARRILDEAGEWTIEEPRVHHGEHSIEVELPFLKYLFPESRFVPIAVNPDSRAVPLGTRVGEIVKEFEGSVVIIGSTDLTHYGDVYYFTPTGYGPQAYQWLRENDALIIRLAERMEATALVEEASRHQNACGAGAMAATLAAAQILGARRGYQVEYTTSFDAMPEEEFRMAVGYAGLVF